MSRIPSCLFIYLFRHKFKLTLRSKRKKSENRETSMHSRRSCGKQSPSPDRHGSLEDLERHHRLPRSGSLPSILSPKLADEDLENSTASGDNEAKHHRNEVEKDSTEVVMRTPTKFTSSARLNIASANKVTSQQQQQQQEQKTVILQDSPSAPLLPGVPGKTFLLPRIQPQQPQQQQPQQRINRHVRFCFFFFFLNYRLSRVVIALLFVLDQRKKFACLMPHPH